MRAREKLGDYQALDVERQLDIVIELLMDVRDLLQKAEDRMAAMEASFKKLGEGK